VKTIISATAVQQPRAEPSERIARVARRTPATLVLLDALCRVLSVSRDVASDDKDCGTLIDAQGQLSSELNQVAMELIDRCEQSTAHAIGFIDEARFARITVLDGDGGRFYALTIEYDRRRDNLARAARRYALTKRETEVLAFILDGARAAEVADKMCISETTVQGYFKRLLSKTRSRNRPSMVAAVCDWEGGRHDHALHVR
jgi:DNA-binding CsgD family transcriptional regulator